MAEDQTPENPRLQVEAAREAFEREFERFAGLTGPSALNSPDMGSPEDLLREVGELRTRHLGKKSSLAASKKMIGRVSPEDRAAFGQLVQQIESDIVSKIESTEQSLRTRVESLRTAREAIDVTLPGTRPRRGHRHPLTVVRERIEDIFVSLGYAIEDGREIETDFYNFDALNIPDNHPARASQDTSTRPTATRCARKRPPCRFTQCNVVARRCE